MDSGTGDGLKAVAVPRLDPPCRADPMLDPRLGVMAVRLEALLLGPRCERGEGLGLALVLLPARVGWALVLARGRREAVD